MELPKDVQKIVDKYYAVWAKDIYRPDFEKFVKEVILASRSPEAERGEE